MQAWVRSWQGTWQRASEELWGRAEECHFRASLVLLGAPLRCAGDHRHGRHAIPRIAGERGQTARWGPARPVGGGGHDLSWMFTLFEIRKKLHMYVSFAAERSVVESLGRTRVLLFPAHGNRSSPEFSDLTQLSATVEFPV